MNLYPNLWPESDSAVLFLKIESSLGTESDSLLRILQHQRRRDKMPSTQEKGNHGAERSPHDGHADGEDLIQPLLHVEERGERWILGFIREPVHSPYTHTHVSDHQYLKNVYAFTGGRWVQRRRLRPWNSPYECAIC